MPLLSFFYTHTCMNYTGDAKRLFSILISKGKAVLVQVYLTLPTFFFWFRAKLLIIDIYVEYIRGNTTQDMKSNIG